MKRKIFVTIQIVILIGLTLAFNQIAYSFQTDKVIFEIGNIYGVSNSPTNLTKFTISQPHVITQIVNYHWNNARGAAPGTISLKDSIGNIYGPWTTKGSPGQGGVPNAYWTAMPNVRIPAGEYTVIDSNPMTWAQNSQSNNRGFTRVVGYLWKPAGQRELVAIVENQSKVNVLIWQDPYEPKGMNDVLKYHLEPGWKTGLKVKITANGQIKFMAGSGGASDTGQFNKVVGSCFWTDDPSNTTRIPYVIFDVNRRLACKDGKK